MSETKIQIRKSAISQMKWAILGVSINLLCLLSTVSADLAMLHKIIFTVNLILCGRAYQIWRANR